MGDVLVIGNGFDLAHNLRTSYNHFIEYVKNVQIGSKSVVVGEEDIFFKECIENNGFIKYFLDYTNEVPGWVDLEKLIREIIGYFELFFSNYIHIIDNRSSITWDFRKMDISNSGKLKTINCLHMFPLYDLDNSFGYTKTKHLDKKYYTHEYGLNKGEILKLLKSQLDDVIELLQIYLSKHIQDDLLEPIKAIDQISSINPSYIISFNYTDTYKTYGINPNDVFHVHGSLDNNNMVLGFNDDDQGNLDFVYFKKYFQRIQKLTGYIDESRFPQKYDVDPVSTLIHFYGHSMDKTDGDIIKKLSKLSNGFVIYKYSQEDYEQKVINLIDVFGKEDATEMIQTGFIRFVTCEQ